MFIKNKNQKIKQSTNSNFLMFISLQLYVVDLGHFNLCKIIKWQCFKYKKSTPQVAEIEIRIKIR